MGSSIQATPWAIVVILCLTVGLAPFSPEPHIVEKTRLILHGQLSSFVDFFDFIFHLSPFVLFTLKTYYSLKK